MPFRFTSADVAPYTPGSLFLGYSDIGQEVGIKTERHGLTVAGSRSGKGAALIVPNLLRWPHSALVVDPKGENAMLTYEARLAMGQAVHILDPFHEADVPDEVRARFNPLASIDPASLSAREDIQVIADGLVIRHKAEDGEWYDGAVSILAGLIAHTISTQEPERRTLASIRDMLNFRPDVWNRVLRDMAANPACGGLAQSAAALCSGKTKSAGEFLSGARRSIDSFGADALQAVMGDSTFQLSDLKAGRCTVMIIIPSRYIEQHARFFRLFVRMALNAMETPLPGRAGLDRLKGTPCLFILDEFFSLGRIDAIQKAAGRLAGNGVHLWPFVQDLGQLETLYGKHGVETFLGNADARIFFGNSDPATLGHVCQVIGTLKPHEVHEGPPSMPHIPVTADEYVFAHMPQQGRVPFPAIGKNAESWAMMNYGLDLFHAAVSQANAAMQLEVRAAIEERRRAAEVVHQNAMAAYQHAMREVGTPRLAPEEVAALTGKGLGEKLARSMIVFGPAGHCYNIILAPYFLVPPRPVVRPLLPGQAPDKVRVWVRQRQEQFAELRSVSEKRAYTVLAVSLGVGGLMYWAFGFHAYSGSKGTVVAGMGAATWWWFVRDAFKDHRRERERLVQNIHNIDAFLRPWVAKHGPPAELGRPPPDWKLPEMVEPQGRG